MENTVTLTVELTDNEAHAFSQFLKRVGIDDYRQLSNLHNEGEDQAMRDAGYAIQRALADKGYNPR